MQKNLRQLFLRKGTRAAQTISQSQTQINQNQQKKPLQAKDHKTQKHLDKISQPHFKKCLAHPPLLNKQMSYSSIQIILITLYLD